MLLRKERGTRDSTHVTQWASVISEYEDFRIVFLSMTKKGARTAKGSNKRERKLEENHSTRESLLDSAVFDLKSLFQDCSP